MEYGGKRKIYFVLRSCTSYEVLIINDRFLGFLDCLRLRPTYRLDTGHTHTVCCSTPSEQPIRLRRAYTGSFGANIHRLPRLWRGDWVNGGGRAYASGACSGCQQLRGSRFEHRNLFYF